MTIGDSKRLEISEKGKTGVYVLNENKGTDQLHGNYAADLKAKYRF